MASENSNKAKLAAKVLRQTLKGRVVLRSDVGYAETRKVWNAAVVSEPEVFAICATVEDVQSTVRVAREHDLPLSVRGGGHDWAGRALRHGGLVIDLSQMRHVTVDPQTLTATVAGGARARDVIEEATPYGLAAVTGNNSDVGLAGFMLGGGYGPLSSRFGLGVDNLLEAEIILSDGSRTIANAHTNSDLYWALRGGGGNFGVVTSMRVRLHPLPWFFAGIILFPWTEAVSVLRGFAIASSSHPDELSTMFLVVPGPDGNPLLALTPSWSGDPKLGEELIGALEHLGNPIMSHVVPMSYREFIGLMDAQAKHGLHCVARTRWLSELDENTIAALVTSGSNRTSSQSVVVGSVMHGAPTLVGTDETAFGLRDRHFLIEICAMWDQPTENGAATHSQWANDLFQALSSKALPGGYPNLLGPDHHGQIPASFGSNAVRLRRLKNKYDPDNIFQLAVTIPVLETLDEL